MLIIIRKNFLSFQNDELLEILCAPHAGEPKSMISKGGKIMKIKQSIKPKKSCYTSI